MRKGWCFKIGTCSFKHRSEIPDQAPTQLICPPGVTEITTPLAAAPVVIPKQVTACPAYPVLLGKVIVVATFAPHTTEPPAGVLTVVPMLSASALNTAHSLARPTVSPTLALASARSRALRNWGNATAESKPMIATTIISSTKVKPLRTRFWRWRSCCSRANWVWARMAVEGVSQFQV